MEHRLPKEITGKLPPNTIDTDFRSDLFAALLSEAGFDLRQIVMVRNGGSGTNIAKDIESVDHKSLFSVIDSSYIEIKTNGRSIYDSLPEGLFHSSVYPNMAKSKEKILEEIKQHRDEEFFIRRFLGLFENEVDQEAIKTQLLELKYDKKNSYRNYVEVFSAYWPIISSMPIHNALLLLKVIPHVHQIRNSLQEVGSALSLIVDAPVMVELKPRPRYIKAQKMNRIGNMRLGVDSVSVGMLCDAEKDLYIHIGDIRACEAERFLPGNSSHRILVALTDIFLGADKEFEIGMSVIASERKAYLKSEDNAYPCYLGINAYL